MVKRWEARLRGALFRGDTGGLFTGTTDPSHACRELVPRELLHDREPDHSSTPGTRGGDARLHFRLTLEATDAAHANGEAATHLRFQPSQTSNLLRSRAVFQAQRGAEPRGAR